MKLEEKVLQQLQEDLKKCKTMDDRPAGIKDNNFLIKWILKHSA